ncbi:MAG: glycosyltransferase family 2 protein [Sarcina sp.]
MAIKVSIVMSVFNGEKFLKEAIESILNQTFKNFEFLIINDGSTDQSLDILKSYSDERIKILDNSGNKGLIYSLNRGVKESQGEYIARMDADDISMPNRLEKQVEFLDENIDVNLVGSSIECIFEGIPLIKKLVKAIPDYEFIKVKAIFESTFYHPTVMFRKSIIEQYNLTYDERYKHAEDYGLWNNMMLRGKVSNLNEPLLNYRIVKTSVTRKANKDIDARRKVFTTIYRDYFDMLGISYTEEELNMHFEVCMIQNMDAFKYSVKEKEIYLSNLKEKLKTYGFKDDYINEAINNVASKMYIYQEKNIKNINENLICNKKVLKKMYYIENCKRKIKKFYK